MKTFGSEAALMPAVALLVAFAVLSQWKEELKYTEMFLDSQ